MAIQAPEGYGSGGEVCVFWCNEVRVAQLPSSANTNARYHVLHSTSLDDPGMLSGVSFTYQHPYNSTSAYFYLQFRCLQCSDRARVGDGMDLPH